MESKCVICGEEIETENFPKGYPKEWMMCCPCTDYWIWLHTGVYDTTFNWREDVFFASIVSCRKYDHYIYESLFRFKA